MTEPAKKPRKYQLSERQAKAIETVLSRGYSVELKPVKDGIKLVKVIREQV